MSIDPASQAALDLPGLARAEVRRTPAPKAKPPPAAAAQDPVARVLVDVPLAHLDRPFDYLVPQSLADMALPGVRVKVRFAGQDVDGFIVERCARSEHDGRLQPLRRVVSAEPVLSAEIAELTREIAERWAGTRSDVLRLAIPPRHATTEKAASAGQPVAPPPHADAWSRYEGGTEAMAAWARGEPVRVVWSARPGEAWPARLAEAVAATAALGRGVVVCLPDRRDVDRLDQELSCRLGPDRHVVLTADAGPAERYRGFLAVSRGAVRVAIGTRAAAFAPVHDLGLVVVWDDGDDLFAEPRAPYCHTREVLLLRARQTGAGALLGGFARSVEAHYLIRTGWAQEVVSAREALRDAVRVSVAGAADVDHDPNPVAAWSRLPRVAFQTISQAAQTGPVLVQNPRAGYALRLACDSCRTPTGCVRCHGPLRLTGPATPPSCAWCGVAVPGWTCPECGGHGLRAPVLGAGRTAEEFARAFPGTAVRTSSAGKVIESVDAAPGIVVATPGAEPVADGGYAAVVLLDVWLALGRDDLRAEEEALRRWMNAAGMVRSVSEGGAVVAVGEPGEPAVQALVRWDPGGFAQRQADERRSAHLPPASRMATITGAEAELAALRLDLPQGGEVLGPVQVEEEQFRLVVRVPRAEGAAMSAALRDLQQRRSARKLPHLRIQVDPLHLT